MCRVIGSLAVGGEKTSACPKKHSCLFVKNCAHILRNRLGYCVFSIYYLICFSQETMFRKPVTERVAVTIWKLATNVEYQTLSNTFSLGRSTVGKIVMETWHEIAVHLLTEFVKIPSGDKLKEIVDGFENFWGFPQAVGAIDGSHIPIIRPEESGSDYYNRKGYYSVLVQGLVDHRGIFLDVVIGWPGKIHDARVFANSSLYKKGMSSSLFPDWKRTLSGVEVYVYNCYSKTDVWLLFCRYHWLFWVILHTLLYLGL